MMTRLETVMTMMLRMMCWTLLSSSWLLVRLFSQSPRQEGRVGVSMKGGGGGGGRSNRGGGQKPESQLLTSPNRTMSHSSVSIMSMEATGMLLWPQL